jgi:hypothetical protein
MNAPFYVKCDFGIRVSFSILKIEQSVSKRGGRCWIKKKDTGNNE